MKWLFLLLLIVNIAIFGWGYQQEQIPKPVVEAGRDIGDMRLISELAEESKAEDETDPEQKEETGSQPISETEEQVVSETPQSEQTSSVDAPEQSTKPQQGEVAVSRCGVIGPLKDRQEAKEIVDDLSQSGLTAKLERKIEKEQIGYWVVIPPVEDGSQAQAKIEELAKVGVEDIWHFRGGGMKNAISLGMFAKKENAEKLSQEVLAKGFETEMRPRYINKTSYLVRFSISKPKNVAEEKWREVEEKYSKLPFKKQSCE
jgi:cell division protein FtsN